MRVTHTETSVKRIAGAVLFLLLAVGWGQLSAKGPEDTPKAKHWNIVVGPGACDLSENGQPASKQAVSKKQGHQVTWKSNAGQPLFLVFHLPTGCIPPFKNMKPIGKDDKGLNLYQLGDGTGDTVRSGPTEKDACEGSEIKYDQNLGGNKCDGIIIIQP
jgi:hypothetical protein